MVKNLLSIDVESLCYLPEFSLLGESARRRITEEYVIDAHRGILEMLERYDTVLTFFVLGELFEWYPWMIEEILEAGHEVAYHSHSHEPLTSGEVLEESLRKSRDFITRFRPVGFRAPWMCMKREYLGLLKQHGFRYDSSVYSSKTCCNINGIIEVPVSIFPYLPGADIGFSTRLKFKNLLTGMPFGSGYVIGALQSGIDFFINRFNKQHKQATLFLHNWQIRRPQGAAFLTPKYLLSHPSRIHYLPYALSMKKTLEHLLKNFEFYTYREFIEEGE